MKKLLVISVLMLTGCSTMLESYLMKYDTNEYAQIAGIRTTASLSKATCENETVSKEHADQIAKQTIMFKNYVQYLPHNSKVIAASTELDSMAQGLSAQYQKGKVSVVFCKVKFETIEKSAETMQKTIGDKPR
jgi:hypothetical protein